MILRLFHYVYISNIFNQQMDEEVSRYTEALRVLRESSAQIFSRSYHHKGCLPIAIEKREVIIPPLEVETSTATDNNQLKRKSGTVEKNSEKIKKKKQKRDFLD